jgi:hypothetical protein
MKKSTPKAELLRTQLLEFLSNPDNTYCTNLSEACTKLGINYNTARQYFTAMDYHEIASEGLKARRKHYHADSHKADLALIDKAHSGDVNALRLYYQMVEGFGEKTFHESRHVVVAEPVRKTNEAGDTKI